MIVRKEVLSDDKKRRNQAVYIISLLLVAAALLIVYIFKSAYTYSGTFDYVWLWILSRLLFDLHRVHL